MAKSITIRSKDGHTASHLLILSTSFFLFPFGLFLAIVSLFISRIQTLRKHLVYRPFERAARPKVLISSNDDITTLSFARLAHAGGYDVFVVDQNRFPVIGPVRWSRVVKKAISVPSDGPPTRLGALLARVSRKQMARPQSLPEAILRLIQREKIELWIPCESVDNSRIYAQAKEVVKRQRTCHVFGTTPETVKLANDYSTFSQYVANFYSSIRCPTATVVASRASIHQILSDALEGQKFLLNRNANRRGSRDSSFSSSGYSGTTLDDLEEVTIMQQEYKTLPLASPNETYASVASMAISREQLWTMHEIHTGRKVLVSCLVFKNAVRAFIARSSTEQHTTSSVGESLTSGSQGRMRHLSLASPIRSSLLDFARKFASTLPDNTSTHLNLHFILQEKSTSIGVMQTIFATGCDFRPSPLLAQLTRQSLTRSPKPSNPFLLNCNAETVMLPSSDLMDAQGELYSLPKAVVDSLLSPLQNFLLWRGSLSDLAKGCALLAEGLVNGQEELFDKSDPLPWVWSWFVVAPVRKILGYSAPRARPDTLK
jgi:hypothetical protein